MRVGNLRHRIIAQKKQTTKDSTGQDVHTWVAFSTPLARSASIRPLKGQELVEARKLGTQVLTSIMVRYDPETAAITHAHRFVREDDSNRKYAIHAIMNHYELDRWLEFWCSEGLQDLI
jgi:SPP1 family predicted phage head-tail adaptor